MDVAVGDGKNNTWSTEIIQETITIGSAHLPEGKKRRTKFCFSKKDTF